MRAYREFEPPSDLVAIVQCLWTHETDGAEPGYRVLPDGCADILFIRENGEPQRLDVIGTMTRAQRFDLPARRMTIALRFRPGMAALGLRVPANELTDAAIPLDDLLGSRVRETRERMEEARTIAQHFSALRRLLPSTPAIQPVHRAIQFLAAAPSDLPIEALAAMANLSPRQFRRVCHCETGLTPKRFARVMRFCSTLERLRRRPSLDWAGLAAECGYYDQAHLINEFQELADVSPARLAAEMSVFSNTALSA